MDLDFITHGISRCNFIPSSVGGRYPDEALVGQKDLQRMLKADFSSFFIKAVYPAISIEMGRAS
jgi:hypothetical protein